MRRPTTNAPKNKSKLRVSFNPGDGDDESKTATQSVGEDERDALNTINKDISVRPVIRSPEAARPNGN